MASPAITSADSEASRHELESTIPTPEPASFADSIRFPKLRDPRYPVHQIADRLEPYLRAIVEKCHPERIILFGSYAYGTPNEHSDIDLLVVRKEITSSRESNHEIRRSFRNIDSVSLPFTLLSETPANLEEKLALGSHFYGDVVTKGIELYVNQTTQRH
jgi:predicted nucleotidyltransferase